MSENKIINWYPGHMAKTKREISELLKIIDIVIEIVDARIPISSHNKDIEEFTKDKKNIIVFNKYDLCDKNRAVEFIKYYESLGYTVVTCDSKNGDGHKNVLKTINTLMIKTNAKRKEKGLLEKRVKVLIVGVPNVGKSTLINKLAGKKIAAVENKPGITKNIATIKIADKIDLMDTPGILWPKITTEEVALNLGSMSIIKEDILPLDKIGLHIIKKLDKNNKDILKRELGIDYYNEDELEELYIKISKYKGIKIIDGEPDYSRISELVLNLIKSEKIKGIIFDELK